MDPRYAARAQSMWVYTRISSQRRNTPLLCTKPINLNEQVPKYVINPDTQPPLGMNTSRVKYRSPHYEHKQPNVFETSM